MDLAQIVHLLDAQGRFYCGMDDWYRDLRPNEPERPLCAGCQLGFEVAKHLALSESPPGESTSELPP